MEPELTALLPAAGTAPDIVKTVQLSAKDKTDTPYYLVPFDVPPGVTRIEIRQSYPKAEDCVVDLGVADPALSPFPSARGHRGWSGGARDRVFVGLDLATPGYVAGPIPEGTWHVLLGLFRLPETPIEMQLEIRFSHEERAPVPARPIPAPVRTKAGWYKGDLQCHTFHSDAYGAPQHLHATAIREGLDFLAVTDHNTVSQQTAYFNSASSPELIFIPAYEFTTESGHANVFGARQVFDFRVTSNAELETMVAQIRASGALFSINHDKPTIAWNWGVPDIDCMEVWQSHWLTGNFISLARYQQRLSQGMRVTAIGGSDFHQPASEPKGNPFTLARPTTYLWLEALSLDAILDAMRAGKSFVTEAPDGPMLTIASGETGMGGIVRGGDVSIHAEVSGARGDVVSLWDAGGQIAEKNITQDQQVLAFTLEDPQRFVRAEIIAKASHDAIRDRLYAFLGDERPGHSVWDQGHPHAIRRAITSPIYIS